jgi:hypothetical protein
VNQERPSADFNSKAAHATRYRNFASHRNLQPQSLLDSICLKANHPGNGTPRRNVAIQHIALGDHKMATIIEKDGGNSGGGGNAIMGFILGAVMLAVGVVGFFMWDNYKSGGAPKAIVVTGQHK